MKDGKSGFGKMKRKNAECEEELERSKLRLNMGEILVKRNILRIIPKKNLNLV